MKLKTLLLTPILALTLLSCNDKEDFIYTPTEQQRPTSKPDKKRPVITITSPEPGSIITPDSTFTVTADVTDNVGVVKVGFTFNGNYVNMTEPPYTATFTVPGFVTDGMYMWVIVDATDGSGNTGFKQLYLQVGQP